MKLWLYGKSGAPNEQQNNWVVQAKLCVHPWMAKVQELIVLLPCLPSLCESCLLLLKALHCTRKQLAYLVVIISVDVDQNVDDILFHCLYHRLQSFRSCYRLPRSDCRDLIVLNTVRVGFARARASKDVDVLTDARKGQVITPDGTSPEVWKSTETVVAWAGKHCMFEELNVLWDRLSREYY